VSSTRIPHLLLGICLASLATGCSLRNDGRSGDILFVRERPIGNTAIYLMSDEGSDVRRLVAGDSPRWSPDGTRFAYTAENEHGNASVWVMNPETREKRLIVVEGAWCCPAWAPDGVRLAYTDGRSTFVVNTATRDAERVSIDFAVDGPLDWSPDGRKLLVSSHVLDLRTGAERDVAPRRSVSGARWSPDGERMVFAEQNLRYNPRRKSFDLPAGGVLKAAIVVADGDGGSGQRVTGGNALDSDPAFSGDGERLYFARRPPLRYSEKASGQSEIYALDLETRSLRRLTDSAAMDRSPDARPPHRSLPDVPAPATGGDVVVPDLVDELVSLESEGRRFRALGLKLRAWFPPPRDWLFVVTEQVPVGGSRVPRNTVVKLDGYDLAGIYHTFRKRFSARIWKAQAGCKAGSPRRSLYWDLVDRVLRRGTSRKRVFSLLGEPGRADGGSAAWPVERLVGRCIYLRVEFNGRGRVTRFHQSLS
jgi:hypothetical protein